MKKVIARVELNVFYDAAIHCPFCGQKVVDTDAGETEALTNPCPHTLFIAHDEGFEFRSGRFDEHLGLTGISDDDIELPDMGIDGLTDTITIPDAVKFASYVGPPSGFGAYVGFAPFDAD